MLIPIPIHSLSSYALVSLTNLTLGSFFIASHIYQNWLRKKNLSLLDANALIKGIFVIFGFTLINPETIFPTTFGFELVYLFCGCIIGIGYYKFESWALRILPQFAFSPVDSSPRKTNNIRNVLSKKSRPVSNKPNQQSYLSGGIVAAFEEILFRGFVTVICLGLPNMILSTAGLILVSIIFALSHINLGYQHVITKLILGGICLFSFLLTGDITTSIAVHLTFNILAIHKIRSL